MATFIFLNYLMKYSEIIQGGQEYNKHDRESISSNVPLTESDSIYH